jgi:hypothetical protein
MHPNLVLEFVTLLERNIIPDRGGYTNVAGDHRCAFNYDIVTIEVDDSNDVIILSSGNAIRYSILTRRP